MLGRKLVEDHRRGTCGHAEDEQENRHTPSWSASRHDAEAAARDRARQGVYSRNRAPGKGRARVGPYLDSVRDFDYAEHLRALDDFVYKRNTLMKIRRGIGFEKDLIAALAVRPNATPELLIKSLQRTCAPSGRRPAPSRQAASDASGR